MSRCLARLLVAVTVTGGVLTGAAGTAAANTCATTYELGPAPASANGAVGVLDPSEWWHQASARRRVVTLTSYGTEVALYAWAGTCGGVQVCAGTSPCVVPYSGRLVIEARYLTSTVTATAYTLTVEETAGDVTEPPPAPPPPVEPPAPEPVADVSVNGSADVPVDRPVDGLGGASARVSVTQRVP